MTTEVRINHPDYQPGRGEKSTDRQIVLHGEAYQAYRLWHRIWGNRRDRQDPYTGVRQDTVERIIADGGLLGDLVLIAVGDATIRPVRDERVWDPARSPQEWRAERFAAYEVATALHAYYAASMPAPVSLVPAGYHDETCSHGRPFTADCADCEA